MDPGERKKAVVIFIAALGIILALFAASIARTFAYNRTEHRTSFTGTALFSAEAAESGTFSVHAEPRSNTWTKLFDLNHEGYTDHDYRAYTYDFTFSNNTRDEVRDFSFRLTFTKEVFLASAWNGALEIHQQSENGETVATIPDLRDFAPEEYPLAMVNVDGETFISMLPGDYLVYHPSTAMNAMEMPVKPHEGTTPGFILYVPIEESIEDSSLELTYTFRRTLTGEPLFWVSAAGLCFWLIALLNFAITSAQLEKYREQHERDNEIINESIETFVGFIDAKDPYTKGHSKRVAHYTRRIAEEMGYTGEDLDRIYYIALLHDSGKIGVPDHILRKPGKLTPEEYEIIKSHTVRGGEILASFKSLEHVTEGALYHHERYDGRGYPAGLAGEDIPLIARMICVADSFDAMNTNRVYRNRLTKEQILSELESNRGTQFDPAIADIMLRLLRENQISFDE